MASVQEAMQRVINAAKAVTEDTDFMSLQELGIAVSELETATDGQPAKCQAKYPGEPTFTVVGRDAIATAAVAAWIDRAEVSGVNQEKVMDARQKLVAFNEWQNQNMDKVKLPD